MEKEIVIKSFGGYAFKFENGWTCANSGLGLGVQVSQLPATRKSKLEFSGGMVISKKDAKRLRNLINELLNPSSKEK